MQRTSARERLRARYRGVIVSTAIAIAAVLVPAIAGGADSGGGTSAVYWSNSSGNALSSANLDGSGGADLSFSGVTVSAPSGTAIDAFAGEIYWANAGNDTIAWALLKGTGGTLDTTGATVSDPQGLAIDPSNSKRVYWANGTGGTGGTGAISWAALSNAASPSAGDLITGAGVSAPDGIAVDPADGTLFWTNSTGTGPGPGAGSIMSARVDGTNVAEVPVSGATVDTPRGIALDPVTATLYWTNSPAAGRGSISYWNLDTDTGGDLVTAADVNHPQGLAIDPVAGRLYWANAADGTISYANLDGSGSGTLSTAGATAAGPSFPVLLVPPAPSSPPVISGTAAIGSSLTCQSASWATDVPASFYYRAPRNLSWQWSRNGLSVAGATTASFAPAAAGSYTCSELGKNHAGTTTQTSAAVIVSDVPIATTSPAAAIGPTGALLNGTVEPEYATTGYRFQYGLTPAYGSQAPLAGGTITADGATHAVSQQVSGLQPNRTYHFRLVATNVNGTSYGADHVFSTTARPWVSTDAAASPSDGSAMLRGRINPENLATRYYFEYGRTGSYGSRVPPTDTVAGADARTHSVSARVTGLAPNRTYHFRLVAVSIAGTTYGADRTFGTLPLPGAAVHGRIGTVGASLRVGLGCAGASTQRCRFIVTARTYERRSAGGRQVTGVSANRPATGARQVIVTRRVMTVTAGHRRNASVRLNQTGRMLRNRFGVLPARVTVTNADGHGHTRTLRRARVWFGANPPRAGFVGGVHRTSRDRLAVRLHCSAVAGQTCSGTIELTTRELLAGDGRTVTGVAASTAARSRLVTLADARYRVHGGSTRTLSVRLHSASRALLSRFSRVPARATIFINHKGYTLMTAHRTVTLRHSRALGDG